MAPYVLRWLRKGGWTYTGSIPRSDQVHFFDLGCGRISFSTNELGTLLLSCPPSLALSKIMQYLKGRSSRLLQDEFPELKKKYWGYHLWARGYFCATVGTVAEEIIRNYIANQFRDEKNDIFRIEE
ncbi:IS200/IS605 family transposase [Bacillus sp. FJAT-47783]|uniref:IS200/IS605 family transposase n=1 Tax=Bacillus sp. FJAT-47783 TaxID=2922712 RepID=UPI00325FC7F6